MQLQQSAVKLHLAVSKAKAHFTEALFEGLGILVLFSLPESLHGGSLLLHLLLDFLFERGFDALLL